MFEKQEMILISLLCASAVSLILPFLVFILRKLVGLFIKKDYVSRGLNRKLIAFSACLIASIWCLRYAVGYYGITFSAAADQLTPFEEILNSLVHTLQTFSMDEDYTDYILKGKEMMADLFGADSLAVSFYGGYAAILNCIAPIAGGAIIFEILASVFPTLLLRASYLAVWREKYFFSELNEGVISLIGSIAEEHKDKLRKPVLIITDSYIDDESERSAELLGEAKRLGAICVKNDLVHIAKNFFGKRKIFLVDMDENANVQALIDLSQKLGKHYVKKTEFYLFASSDIYVHVEKQIRRNFAPNENDVPPVIIPVNGYRNIISNMFSDLPLFEPIVHEYSENKKAGKKTELNITILGSGHIGTEMFLGTYWCGQILDCKLHITVVSNETQKEFERRIDYLNPEIFRSMDAGDPILRIYRDNGFAPKGATLMSEPYCSISHRAVDVRSDEFLGLLDEDEEIKKTDYFFIALGSDNENIAIANKLREVIGHNHMLSDGDPRTVITYVVYDPKLASALNGKRLYSYSKSKNDIYMQAVGSISEVYSTRNVFMTDTDPLATKAGEAYYTSGSESRRKLISAKLAKDEYSYRSDMAKATHLPYKIFSSGIWKRSVFDDLPDYAGLKQTYVKTYEDTVRRCAAGGDRSLLHRLAWLEHRRWNSYLRSRGFRGAHVPDENGALDPDKTFAYMKDFMSAHSQKNLELKRHLCLAECDILGIRADMDKKGNFSNYKLWALSESDSQYADLHPDMLDEVIILRTRGMQNADEDDRYDYKQYDYPIEFFGEDDVEKEQKRNGKNEK